VPLSCEIIIKPVAVVVLCQLEIKCLVSLGEENSFSKGKDDLEITMKNVTADFF